LSDGNQEQEHPVGVFEARKRIIKLLTEQEYQAGVREERERIIKWIEENRSGVEFEPGEVIYRDHFNSESLIAFIKGENK
jgi:GTP cyclohydrolase I